MLKQQARLFTKIAVFLDIVGIMLAFSSAYLLVQWQAERLQTWSHYAWLLAIAIPAWLFLLGYFGLYASLRTRTFSQIAANLLRIHAIGGMIITSALFLIDPHGYSRLLVGIFILLSFVISLLTKSIIKLTLSYFRRKGYNVRHLLIVGSGERARSFVSILRQHADWGLVVAGVVSLYGKQSEDGLIDCLHLGEIDQLGDICRQKLVDEVIFSLSREDMVSIDDHVALLQDMGITVRMVLDFYDIPTARTEITMFHGEIPILTFYGKAFDAGQLFLKRCLDLVGSLVGLLFTVILLPFIALAIRLESKGPLFFGQERVGVNGRLFKCWKFRSMFVDAESRKKDLMAQNEMLGAMFKMKDDPRVTRVGKFIRKTSIDELPQFWNVFRGEMSLVGTRPPTPDEVATYENWQRKRICIKPGITGLWQVSGRNQIQNFDDVVRLDIRYIEEWSLWLDFKLLAKTIWVVFARNGAS